MYPKQGITYNFLLLERSSASYMLCMNTLLAEHFNCLQWKIELALNKLCGIVLLNLKDQGSATVLNEQLLLLHLGYNNTLYNYK